MFVYVSPDSVVLVTRLSLYLYVLVVHRHKHFVRVVQLLLNKCSVNVLFRKERLQLRQLVRMVAEEQARAHELSRRDLFWRLANKEPDLLFILSHFASTLLPATLLLAL